MKSLMCAGVLVLCSTLTLPAQDAKDRIDKNLDACLNSPAGASTVGQSECAARAYAGWDAALNQAYEKLMKTLDPAARELLRASERQWLNFVTAEKKFQASWGKQQGTLGGVSAALANVDIVKSRALTLRNYAGGGNPN
jgi:uncharacterized protein YecT (DUF1311 family)